MVLISNTCDGQGVAVITSRSNSQIGRSGSCQEHEQNGDGQVKELCSRYACKMETRF